MHDMRDQWSRCLFDLLVTALIVKRGQRNQEIEYEDSGFAGWGQ